MTGGSQAGGKVLSRPGLAVAIALAVSVGMPGSTIAAGTPAVAVDYDVFAGGLHVLSSGLELSLGSQRYDVRLNAEVAGVPGWFADWWAVVRSGGSIVSGGFDPERNTIERFRRGETRLTELEFAGNGAVTVTYTPERNDGGEPVPTESLLGALDPLSGVAQVMWSITQGANCEATVPVYDGRRRYDLVFTDLGSVQLQRTSHSAYSGEARHCRMRLEPVAGDFDDEDDNSVWNRESDPRRRQLDIWMAQPIAGSPAVPVKMIGRSTLGAVVVHLRGARAGEPLSRSTAGRPDFPASGCGAPC